ncbi:hypothetical protein [Vulgatibacter sp.]|uniref:hypothetical protein n=1 Tax=Vulgatibacter sp. TaxID=1971226 RepID=UPI0035636D5A
MRDHRRILGLLYIAWAVLQLVGAIGIAIYGKIELAVPWLYWLSTVVVSVAYAWVGWRLRLHDPRVRVAAILLGVLALLSFPVGTVLGIYALWSLLRRPQTSEAAQ